MLEEHLALVPWTLCSGAASIISAPGRKRPKSIWSALAGLATVLARSPKPKVEASAATKRRPCQRGTKPTSSARASSQSLSTEWRWRRAWRGRARPRVRRRGAPVAPVIPGSRRTRQAQRAHSCACRRSWPTAGLAKEACVPGKRRLDGRHGGPGHEIGAIAGARQISSRVKGELFEAKHSPAK